MINTTTTRLLHIDAKHECSMNSWIHSLGQLISMFKNISSWIIRLFLSIFFWDLALMPCLKVTNYNCVVEKFKKYFLIKLWGNPQKILNVSNIESWKKLNWEKDLGPNKLLNRTQGPEEWTRKKEPLQNIQ